MPNGDSKFSKRLEPLEEFFRPIENALTSFASRHNLRVQKYYHESPSWIFTFRHPQGGIGGVEVARENDDSLSVRCRWWYDDYDKRTRFIKNSKDASLPRDTDAINVEMEKAFGLVLSWEFGSWDEHHEGYGQWSKTFTKEQFDALCEAYPKPST